MRSSEACAEFWRERCPRNWTAIPTGNFDEGSRARRQRTLPLVAEPAGGRNRGGLIPAGPRREYVVNDLGHQLGRGVLLHREEARPPRCPGDHGRGPTAAIARRQRG